MRQQLLIDKINFILVPAVPGPGPAGLQLCPGIKGHIPDENAAAGVQQRQKVLKEGDFLPVGQVVQGIGGDDGVIAAGAEGLRQPPGEVPPDSCLLYTSRCV